MDIKDLNKNQIVLLTLLVSFVTSIATGIITVSLMQQAPAGVTKVINQVVERTVEKVSPVVNAVTGATNTVTTKETTVVVKEDDLIGKSIDTTKPSIVAVREKSINAQGLAVNSFVGWGTVISNNGIIATDVMNVSNDSPYTILTDDGVVFDTKIIARDNDRGIAYVQVVRDKSDKTSSGYNFTSVKVADMSKLHLGQTLIAFGGNAKKAVTVGILSSFNTIEVKGTASTSPMQTKVSSILATISPIGNQTGGPLINGFGEVVGLSTTNGIGDRTSNYVSIALVQDQLEAVLKASQ